MNIKRLCPWIGYLLIACLGLTGCAPKTSVSATGNVPAAYSHVYMSVQEIWFNTTTNATPDDPAWIKFPLQAPVTVDLATSMNGQLTALTTGLTLPIGTYQQVRLIPVDGSAALLSTAQSLGAHYNSEVDYTDASNTQQVLPLELLNPDKGIGIATSIQVTGTGVNILSSGSSSSSGTNSSGSDASATGSSTSSKPFSIAVNANAATDVVPFSYATDANGNNGINAALLSPHMTAYDASTVGAIQGTLAISNLGGTSSITTPSTSNVYDIQVTAETLSTDGTRHVVVNSAPVKSDGTFTLYPLATSSSSPSSYDLVIHGPAIATVIIKGVTVSVGDPSSTTPVNVGTITPRPASSFEVKLDTTNTTTLLPAGALVGFYQTLPNAGFGSNAEVPYIIEQKAIDPFTRAFPTNWPVKVSSGSIDYGTFGSSGNTISLSTSNPQEGAGTYQVAASAPLFGDGPLTSTSAIGVLAGGTTAAVTVPTVNPSTTAAILVPTPSSVTGTTTTGVTLQIGHSNTYDRGYVILSHDGAIVATAALDTLLAQGSSAGALTMVGIPTGTGTSTTPSTTIGAAPTADDSALYYVSVRVWSSSSPGSTVKRETYPTALDLRNTSAAVYSLNID